MKNYENNSSLKIRNLTLVIQTLNYMSIFCFKKIEQSTRLGELFRTNRLKQGWDLDKIPFRNSPIASKYLHALEEENFTILPKTKTYRLAYVREYAVILGLNPDQCAAQFIYENGLEDITPLTPYRKINFFPFSSWSIFIRNTMLAISVCLFIGYLAWQIKGILEPPKLFIFSPIDGYVSLETNTLVQGQTEQGAKVAINGEAVDVNDRGQFAIKIDLVKGLNTINISTTKKHGKTTQKTVYVIVKQESFTTLLNLKKYYN